LSEINDLEPLSGIALMEPPRIASLAFAINKLYTKCCCKNISLSHKRRSYKLFVKISVIRSLTLLKKSQSLS